MTEAARQIPALIELPFEKEEFAWRRERLLDLMKRADMDALVLSSVSNYYYVSGLATNVPLGVLALVIRSDGRGFWIGRRSEMTNVETFMVASAWSEIARAIADEENTYEVVGQAIAKLMPAGAKVGFELNAASMPANGINTVALHASGIEILNGSGLVESLRVIKSPRELSYLRAAGKMTAAVIRETVTGIVEGQTDSGLASRAFAALARLGSDPQPVSPTIVSGPRSALAHATFSNSPIERGELITIEIGAVVARYCTPAYRIAMLGRPSAELARFHDASRAGLLAALEKIGPGMTSHEADRVVREAITDAGYSEYFTVRAGYSIGLGFVPSWDEDHIMKLRPRDERPLRSGMAFHIVPALYKLGTGAVCCSNSIVITDDGTEALVPVEPELLIA
ncbi:MAG: aminopeptidase P family protein [Hyphomicrobiales bacterium]|nr:MAG: aminopeptidase P family protein [Hyphomicrobiales bacterium]